MTLRCILAPLASPDTLRGQVTDADWAAAAAFPPRRRAEYLTWRAVVYRELGAVPIGYDAAGGPVLIGDPRHIGVSHGGGHAAVVISDRPCAVDIESETRRFTPRGGRISLLPAEAATRPTIRRVAGVVWCAKETLYKLARRRGLDLLRDLAIERIDFAAGEVVGRVRGGEPIPMPAGTARRADRRPHPLIRSDIRRTAFSMQRPIRKSTATYALGPGRTRNHPCCNVSQQGVKTVSGGGKPASVNSRAGVPSPTADREVRSVRAPPDAPLRPMQASND